MGEAQRFRQFSDSLPSTPAEDWVFCPDCRETVIRKTSFNGFSAWNYKQERIVDRDERGQLRTRTVWYRFITNACGTCRT